MIIEPSNDDDSVEIDENDRKECFLNTLIPDFMIWPRFYSYSSCELFYIQTLEIVTSYVKKIRYVSQNYDKFSK